MLSEGALDYLQDLTLQRGAERMACYLPFGGIYWDDELPDFRAFQQLPDKDRNLILRLFFIRFQIWKKQILLDSDQAFWDHAVAEVPHYALFHRLHLNSDDQRKQAQIEMEVQDFFASLQDLVEDVNGLKKRQKMEEDIEEQDLQKWWRRIW